MITQAAVMVDRGPWPSSVGLLARQTRHQVAMFVRVPAAVFFTLALPVVILVVVNAVFGNGTALADGGEWPTRQFYTGALAAFTAVSATYTNVANMLPIRREEGVLTRWRSTPLPVWVYLGGHLAAAVIIATIGAIFMLLIGVVAYGLEITPSALPAAAVTFVVSVVCFAALGTAVASAVPTASAASSVANATILPLAFVSNVFIPLDDPPRWLDVIGDVFPLKPFVESFQAAFHPTAAATSPDIGSLLVVLAWGVGGMLIALRRFRWDTPAGGSTRRRRRQRNT